MTFMFSEIQASGLAKQGFDPHDRGPLRMLEGYKGVLLIDTGAGDTRLQRTQAQNIADLFGWLVDTAREKTLLTPGWRIVFLIDTLFSIDSAVTKTVSLNFLHPDSRIHRFADAAHTAFQSFRIFEAFAVLKAFQIRGTIRKTVVHACSRGWGRYGKEPAVAIRILIDY